MDESQMVFDCSARIVRPPSAEIRFRKGHACVKQNGEGGIYWKGTVSWVGIPLWLDKMRCRVNEIVISSFLVKPTAKNLPNGRT
jgi:hypothetical protein